MTIYVLTYQRKTGRRTIDQFAEGSDDQAFARRRQLEVEVDDDAEVVLLRGESIRQFETTHARYFRTPSEIAGRLLDELD